VGGSEEADEEADESESEGSDRAWEPKREGSASARKDTPSKATPMRPGSRSSTADRGKVSKGDGPTSASVCKQAGAKASALASDTEVFRSLLRRCAAVREDRAPPYEYSVLHASKGLRKMASDGAGIPVHKKGRSGASKPRYLVALPGHLAPMAAGDIGTFRKLDTPHPELFIEWPGQGRLRLRGSLVHPRTKYLTLIPKGSQMTCEDEVSSIIVLSDARWLPIGMPEDAEGEAEIPSGLCAGTHNEPNYSGGAGACHIQPGDAVVEDTGVGTDADPSDDGSEEADGGGERGGCSGRSLREHTMKKYVDEVVLEDEDGSKSASGSPVGPRARVKPSDHPEPLPRKPTPNAGSSATANKKQAASKPTTSMAQVASGKQVESRVTIAIDESDDEGAAPPVRKPSAATRAAATKTLAKASAEPSTRASQEAKRARAGASLKRGASDMQSAGPKKPRVVPASSDEDSGSDYEGKHSAAEVKAHSAVEAKASGPTLGRARRQSATRVVYKDGDDTDDSMS